MIHVVILHRLSCGYSDSEAINMRLETSTEIVKQTAKGFDFVSNYYY